MAAAARAREYYRTLDEHDYERLRALLAPEFVQERPDATLEGRERFVRFMRDERPRTDTSHAVDAVYVTPPSGGGQSEGGGVGESVATAGGDAAHTGAVDGGVDGTREVAVRGRLLTADGERMARFVDVFVDGDAGFVRLDTYTL
jgi:hypothetical protein